MNNQNDAKQQHNTGINPVAAVIGGVVAGAAMAGTAAVLADKKNRDHIKDALEKGKEDVQEKVKEARDKAEHVKGDVEKKAGELKSDAQDAAKKAQQHTR